MSFWSSPSFSSFPRQKHRWVVYLGQQLKDLNEFKNPLPFYFAKSVDRPSYTLKSTQAKLLYSHTVNFPTRPVWNPITVTFYDAVIRTGGLVVYPNRQTYIKPTLQDDKNITDAEFEKPFTSDISTAGFFYNFLQDVGYYAPIEERNDKSLFMRKYNFKDEIIKNIQPDGNKVKIVEIDEKGFFKESWFLNNPIITDVKFDKFDYSSEEVALITVTIAYDWAEYYDKNTYEKGVNKVLTDKEEAETKRKQEEEAAAAKRKSEEEAAAAKRKSEEEAAAEAKRKEEEKAAAEAKRKEEEKAAAEAKRKEEEAEAKRKSEEEAAAKRKDEAVAKALKTSIDSLNLKLEPDVFSKESIKTALKNRGQPEASNPQDSTPVELTPTEPEKKSATPVEIPNTIRRSPSFAPDILGAPGAQLPREVHPDLQMLLDAFAGADNPKDIKIESKLAPSSDFDPLARDPAGISQSSIDDSRKRIAEPSQPKLSVGNRISPPTTPKERRRQDAFLTDAANGLIGEEETNADKEGIKLRERDAAISQARYKASTDAVDAIDAARKAQIDKFNAGKEEALKNFNENVQPELDRLEAQTTAETLAEQERLAAEKAAADAAAEAERQAAQARKQARIAATEAERLRVVELRRERATRNFINPAQEAVNFWQQQLQEAQTEGYNPASVLKNLQEAQQRLAEAQQRVGAIQ